MKKSIKTVFYFALFLFVLSCDRDDLEQSTVPEVIQQSDSNVKINKTNLQKVYRKSLYVKRCNVSLVD